MSNSLQATIDRLPSHLKPFVVEQDYSSYTPIDHALWRYVMRLNYSFLSENAHQSYLDGLRQTGINIETIPDIRDMNDILSEIGWGAVCVDGFIPPTAFMEFQAYNVLVIAADIRQLKHIEYTPAPDIIHEAAGHAPIIADPEYAEYLRLFGEIGSKAISSSRDYELYEAIRHLSILKEDITSSEESVIAAEQKIADLQNDMGEPSEMAKIRNLHWWTVEYGLIGTTDKPKIYGAGLLSSIAESVSCLKDDVKKIPYSIEAADFSFDITTAQPQLFVTPDFKYLTEVLNEFADTMALRTGGTSGLGKVIASNNTATCVYSSGLQVSGTFTDLICDEEGNPAYIKTTGPTALFEENSLLTGHGKEYHADGFGAPVGNIKGFDKALKEYSIAELRDKEIEAGKVCSLEFTSGVLVQGKLRTIRKNRMGVTQLMTFDDCTVSIGEQVLFQAEWGVFDMAVGESIVSAFSGPANIVSFGEEVQVPSETTPVAVYDEKMKSLHGLYQQLRDIRESGERTDDILKILETLKSTYPEDTLLTLEIYEVLRERNALPQIAEQCHNFLIERGDGNARLKVLINDGLELIEG